MNEINVREVKKKQKKENIWNLKRGEETVTFITCLSCEYFVRSISFPRSLMFRELGSEHKWNKRNSTFRPSWETDSESPKWAKGEGRMFRHLSSLTSPFVRWCGFNFQFHVYTISRVISTAAREHTSSPASDLVRDMAVADAGSWSPQPSVATAQTVRPKLRSI